MLFLNLVLLQTSVVLGFLRTSSLVSKKESYLDMLCITLGIKYVFDDLKFELHTTCVGPIKLPVK